MNHNFQQTINLEEDLLSPEEAIRCLSGSVKVLLPVPNISACNNLNEYYAKSTAGLQRSQPAGVRSTSERGSKNFQSKFSPQPFAVPIVRNFDRILKKNDATKDLPAEVTSSVQHKRVQQDVFSRAEKLASTLGPLVLLRNRLDKTVRVMIRRRRNVPFISRVIEYKGTLILFDKHVNIYLKDVIESFKYNFGGQILKRARHRDDILIRGDNVILVY